MENPTWMRLCVAVVYGLNGESWFNSITQVGLGKGREMGRIREEQDRQDREAHGSTERGREPPLRQPLKLPLDEDEAAFKAAAEAHPDVFWGETLEGMDRFGMMNCRSC